MVKRLNENKGFFLFDYLKNESFLGYEAARSLESQGEKEVFVIRCILFYRQRLFVQGCVMMEFFFKG